jgi:hypothetical protein
MNIYAREIIREPTTAEKGLPGTTIGLREEGSRIMEVRACRLKENSVLFSSCGR